MELSLKLKALNKLRQSASDAARTAIAKEYAKAISIIQNNAEYQLLHEQLEILSVIGDVNSVNTISVLSDFIDSIKTKTLLFPDMDSEFVRRMSKYQNATSLSILAIEVIAYLRYSDTENVLKLFLSLSVSQDEQIKGQAIEGVKALASYNPNAIYGVSNQGGYGLGVQQTILGSLNQLSPKDIKSYFSSIIEILRIVISPEMDFTSRSTYDSFTISKSSVHTIPEFSEIREKAITLLLELYKQSEATLEKIKVVDCLNNAARNYVFGVADQTSIALLNRDACKVLGFYTSIASTQDLPVVQKVEHNGYWIFYHSNSQAINDKAYVLEEAIAKNTEYQIYKVLVGFEGIFQDWNELKINRNANFDDDQYRDKKLNEFATSINDSNYDTWRSRILLYATTQSNDLATFPKFCEFLNVFAKLRPDLALNFLTAHHEEVSEFLVPILRPIWASSWQRTLLNLVKDWLMAKKYLWSISRMFVENDSLEIGLLQQILITAKEVGDISALSSLISVVVSNHERLITSNRDLIALIFTPTIKAMSELKSANWIFDFWYRREAAAFLKKLQSDEIDLILEDMMHVQEINYHAEEVLYLIADNYPQKVIDFMCMRLAHSSDDSNEFEAVPFELYKLNTPLAKHPELVLTAVYELYLHDDYLFQFKGARLVRIIFKEFDESMEASLIRFVNSEDITKIHFVLAILLNYEGQLFLHKVIREIVAVLPAEHELLVEAMMALEATGVVSGEFGFVLAYKRKTEEIEYWLNDTNPKVKAFADKYIKTLESQIVQEDARAKEAIALRKHNFE